jgi:hypothetical protein
LSATHKLLLLLLLRYIHHHFELNSYSAPMTMGFWSTIAPAVVSNYCTRILLGRYFMCTAGQEADLSEQHGQHALAKVTGYDVLLAVGHDELNDVIFKHALGWTNGTFRWGARQQGLRLGLWHHSGVRQAGLMMIPVGNSK